MGTEKQRQQDMDFCFGCGGLGLLFTLCWPDFLGRGLFFFSCRSTSPNLSASVSRLVLPSSIGVAVALGPGLECADMLAWSLCCQQYRDSSRGSGFRDGCWAMGRRHGRPLEVMPRHVEEAFLESARARRDSGVLATKGIVVD